MQTKPFGEDNAGRSCQWGKEVEAAIEPSAIRKIYWRLLPIAILTYLLAYIDRINVGFAALIVRGGLHMSATEFSFASVTFF